MASSPRPRILFVARELSATPRSGTALRRERLLGAVRMVGSTTVFTLAPAPPTATRVGRWVTASDPLAARSLEGADAVAAARAGRFPLGVVDSTSAVDEVCALAEELSPDVIVVNGIELDAYVGALRPHARRLILDLDYAQTRGLGEMAAADPHRARSLLWRHLLSGLEATECALLELADQVWVCSDAEHARVRELPGSEHFDVRTVPNVVDIASYPHASRDSEDALVFPARFDYWPNEEAAKVLVDDVLPALPAATVTMVGMAPPPWLTALDHPRVHVTGEVLDVRPYLAAASVMPVPVQSGAGTRLKVLEAFAAGVPVVSSAVGIGGFDLVDNEHYLLAETADEVVDAITRLRDDGLAARLCANGRSWVEIHGSLGAVQHAVERALLET